MLTINTDIKRVVEVTAAIIATASANVSRNSCCSLLNLDAGHEEPNHRRMSGRKTSNQVTEVTTIIKHTKENILLTQRSEKDYLKEAETPSEKLTIEKT